MKYYKHLETGDVFAYKSEQERQEWGAPDLVEMTPEEVNAHLNPVPTAEQLAAQIRAERDAKIEVVRWRIERAKDEALLELPLTEPLEPLLVYVQALRDVPLQEGFPENVQWPVEPEL